MPDQHAQAFIADGPAPAGFATGAGRISFGVTAKGTGFGGVFNGDFGVVANGGGIGLVSSGDSIGHIVSGGIGVWSSSTTGEAVHGESEQDRGATFSSGRLAQLRLVPSKARLPPARGKVGDLFLHFGSGKFGPNLPPVVELHLCIKDGTPANPALWIKVELGEIVGGV